jgi:hypothetical protein
MPLATAARSVGWAAGPIFRIGHLGRVLAKRRDQHRHEFAIRFARHDDVDFVQ